MRVFKVSIGNIAMCSTDLAMEPAIMNCQKASPSCVAAGECTVDDTSGRKSINVMVVVVVAAIFRLVADRVEDHYLIIVRAGHY